MNREDKIMNRLREHLNEVKDDYEWVGIFLQGSQNYELDYESSDIDSKLIVLPSFADICLNAKPVSFTKVLENNEHIDVKDIRSMIECFKKQNINFIEILFTEFYIINPKYKAIWMNFVAHNEEIAHFNNYAAVNCIAGMVFEKRKALEHPYPSIIDKIEKFGYDPKQLHHIVRCNEFLKRYINNTSYGDCLIPTKKEYLIEIKKGFIPYKDAKEMADRLEEETIQIKREYMDTVQVSINYEVQEYCNQLIIKLMKKKLLGDLT